MFGIVGFVVVPSDGADWATNAKATGALIIWLAAVTAGLAILSRVRLRRARGGKPAVTVGSLVGRIFTYTISDPSARWFGGVVADAVEPSISSLRSENTEQHAETSERLSAVEASVKDLSVRVDAVEQMSHPTGVVADLVDRMQDLAETVRVDRHNARNMMNTVNGSVQLLAEEIHQLRSER